MKRIKLLCFTIYAYVMISRYLYVTSGGARGQQWLAVGVCWRNGVGCDELNSAVMFAMSTGSDLLINCSSGKWLNSTD